MTEEQSERLRKQLAIDEGERLDVYNDHLDQPTVGIGHLVLPTDNLALGDNISPEMSKRY